MDFKTELHCHTCTVSACGRITPEELVEKYVTSGYTTVVLTEHFSAVTFESDRYPGTSRWEDKVDFYLSGYHALQRAAEGKLHVLFGAEFRICKHEASDFLAYGVTEDFLRTYPDLLETDFTMFSNRVRGAGCLLYQAHPFRNHMIVTEPSLLDGVEVYNGNPHVFSRNDIAGIWANRFDLPGIAGSDVHRAIDPAIAGIRTEKPITCNEELLQVLKKRKYTLIREET